MWLWCCSSKATVNVVLQQHAPISLGHSANNCQRFFRHALEDDPDNQSLMLDLADVALALAQPEMAEDFCLQVVASSDRKDALCLRAAKLLLKLEDYQECLNVLAEVTAPQSHTLRATAWDALGEKEKARRERQAADAHALLKGSSPGSVSKTPNLPPPPARFRDASAASQSNSSLRQ